MLCGFGYGCSYTPPIQALLEWFPDKKGLASGIVIAGFGSGALFFTPMMNFLTRTYSQMPQYLGSSLETITEGGKVFTQIGDSLKEVVYATQADLAKLPYSDMMEGFYLVDSGNSGVAMSLATIGAMYTGAIISSAFLLKKPSSQYLPPGWTPPPVTGTSGLNVNTSTVMRTPQFWLLFTTSTLLATGGMGLMSVAKPMIGEVFTSSMPGLVTAAFASSYLMVNFYIAVCQIIESSKDLLILYSGHGWWKPGWPFRLGCCVGQDRSSSYFQCLHLRGGTNFRFPALYDHSGCE